MMIIYDLKCEFDHCFEGWFKNIEEYELQVKDGLLTCPVCESAHVQKIPSVSHIHSTASSVSQDKLSEPENTNAVAGQLKRDNWLKKIGEYVDTHFDDVGAEFVDEAKRIHYGEAKNRNIMGTASFSGIRELAEEGIAVIPVAKIVDKKKLN